MKTTGELRKELAECLAMARDGLLAGDALRGVIGCANQINQSISVETRTRLQLQRESVALHAFGDLPIAGT